MYTISFSTGQSAGMFVWKGAVYLYKILQQELHSFDKFGAGRLNLRARVPPCWTNIQSYSGSI